MVVELDAFELGESPTAPRSRIVLGIFEIEPDLGRQQRVVVGNANERTAREKLRDKLAKRGIERGTAARGISKQRSASRIEVLAQGLELVDGELDGPLAGDANNRATDQVRIVCTQPFLSDD